MVIPSSIKYACKVIEKFDSPIIVIDGRGGSGKSTFAKLLQQNIPESMVINLDDYQVDSPDLYCQKNIDCNFDINFEDRQFNIP